jgi:hypothetical protein
MTYPVLGTDDCTEQPVWGDACTGEPDGSVAEVDSASRVSNVTDMMKVILGHTSELKVYM